MVSLLKGKRVKVMALPGGVLQEMDLTVKDIDHRKYQGEIKEHEVLFAIVDDNGSAFSVTKVLKAEDIE